MESLERILRAHRFLAGIDKAFSGLIIGCAKNVRFEAGQYLFHEGDDADAFYLIREGRIAIEVAIPGRGAITFLTLGEGEIVGVSWPIPPYRWMFGAKAIGRVRAIAIDAKCLRQKCEADHDLGYEMMKRFMPVLIERLHATRMQMLDVYGSHD